MCPVKNLCPKIFKGNMHPSHLTSIKQLGHDQFGGPKKEFQSPDNWKYIIFCPPNWAAFQSGQKKKCQSHFWRIGNTMIINSCICTCRNKFSAMVIFVFNFRIKCILIIWMCVCTCAWCLYYTLTSFWIRCIQVVIFWFTAVTSSPFSVILTKTVSWELFIKGKGKKEKWKNARTKESE